MLSTRYLLSRYIRIYLSGYLSHGLFIVSAKGITRALKTGFGHPAGTLKHGIFATGLGLYFGNGQFADFRNCIQSLKP